MAWEIRFTRHALLRMMERGITQADVDEVVQRGAKLRYERGIMCVFRHIHVACVRHGNTWIVKTVYWDWED